MSNFGDSSNYESYPYYEPTSNASQQQMSHPPPGSSSQQAAEMNSWSNGQRGWSNVQQQQRFQGQGHDSNTDDGSIVQNNVHVSVRFNACTLQLQGCVRDLLFSQLGPATLFHFRI